jgi:hypothetical protein
MVNGAVERLAELPRGWLCWGCYPLINGCGHLAPILKGFYEIRFLEKRAFCGGKFLLFLWGIADGRWVWVILRVDSALDLEIRIVCDW